MGTSNDLGSHVAKLSHQVQQMQLTLTPNAQPQEPYSFCHMYEHTTMGCYNRESPTLVEDVNFIGVYSGQKLRQQSNDTIAKRSH